jgi:formylglycine-generating enzyme required for sulfatase activity
VEEAQAAVESTSVAEKKREWEDWVRRGKEAFASCRWADAEAHFSKAAIMAQFSTESFQNDWDRSRRALKAPAGMVYVPDGEFQMGSAEGRDFEGPEHKASTAEFYLQVIEVTRADYAGFLAEMKDHGRCHPKEQRNKDHTPLRWSDQTDPKKPVYGVDWYDAYSFAAHRGMRLPTEAEFEKAAGWDTLRNRKNLYPWGPTFQQEGGPAFFGCESMASGPIEWTVSTFQPYPTSPARHAFFGRFVVARGGVLSPADAKTEARTFTRFGLSPTTRHLKIGFRCAMVVPR